MRLPIRMSPVIFRHNARRALRPKRNGCVLPGASGPSRQRAKPGAGNPERVAYIPACIVTSTGHGAHQPARFGLQLPSRFRGQPRRRV